MTERDFQNKVLSIAKTFGWLCYHPYDSRRSQPGFPDLVLVRDRVLFRELKTNTGRLGPAQEDWGKKLTKAGADYAVWRPKDIESIIKALR